MRKVGDDLRKIKLLFFSSLWVKLVAPENKKSPGFTSGLFWIILRSLNGLSQNNNFIVQHFNNSAFYVELFLAR